MEKEIDSATATTTFQPQPQCVPMYWRGKRVGSISVGGQLLLIQCGSREVLFEMHNYFGPVPLNKRTHESLSTIPSGFWDAYERWDAGGKLVVGNVCQLRDWCVECRGSGDETIRIDRKNLVLVGKCKRCEGSKLEPAV